MEEWSQQFRSINQLIGELICQVQGQKHGNSVGFEPQTSWFEALQLGHHSAQKFVVVSSSTKDNCFVREFCLQC